MLFDSVLCRKTVFVLILYFKIYCAKLEKNDEIEVDYKFTLRLYCDTFLCVKNILKIKIHSIRSFQIYRFECSRIALLIN